MECVTHQSPGFPREHARATPVDSQVDVLLAVLQTEMDSAVRSVRERMKDHLKTVESPLHQAMEAAWAKGRAESEHLLAEARERVLALEEQLAAERLEPSSETVLRNGFPPIPATACPPKPPFPTQETLPSTLPAGPSAPGATERVAASSSSPGLPRAEVLEAVSVKTGFPREMLDEYLNSGITLELASPKLIEIFKELGSRFPSAPALDVSRMTEMATLDALIVFLSQSTPSARPSASHAPPPAPSTGAAMSVQDSSGTPIQGPPSESAPLPPVGRAMGRLPLDPSTVTSPFQPVTASASTAAKEIPPSPAWNEASALAEMEAEVEAEIEVELVRHGVRSRVASACGFGVARLGGVGTLTIVPDRDQRVAHALKELLVSESYAVEISSTVPETARGAIVLNGLVEGTSASEGLALQREAFQAALAVSAGLENQEGLFVAVQDTGGDFGITSGTAKAWLGATSGLVKRLSRAHPRLALKALDMECEGRTAEALARKIFRELVEGGPEIQVGLSADGTRLSKVCEETELVERGMPLPENGLVIVHGAGQGILSEPVLELARRQSLRFVLLGSVICQEASEDPFGDTSDPDVIRHAIAKLAAPQADLDERFRTVMAQREIGRLKRRLEALGSSVVYSAIDSGDVTALELILSQMRTEWGDPVAVVHAGGGKNPGEPSIAGDTPSAEAFEGRLRTEVAGIANLLKLLQGDSLRLIGLLSPCSCGRGLKGEVPVAAGNEIFSRLLSVEAGRRGSDCVARLIQWAYADDGTYGSEARESLRSEGNDLIPRRQFGRVIADEWTNPLRCETQVVLAASRSPGNLKRPGAYHRFNVRVDRHVSKLTVPQLEDYVVEGTCMVPATMAMEWLLRFGRQVGGLRGGCFCREFCQEKPIVLLDFEKDQDSFTLEMEDLPGFLAGRETGMRLVDDGGESRFAGIVGMVGDGQAPAARGAGLLPAPELSLERTAWTGNHVYGPGSLFHGPAFKVIHRVDGVSKQGALARFVPPEEANWSREAPVFHPAMIDGVAQLAYVWGLFTQGAEFQLTSIGEFTQAQDAHYNQALRCVLEGVESSRSALKLYAYPESDGGDVVANLRDVGCLPWTRPSQALS